MHRSDSCAYCSGPLPDPIGYTIHRDGFGEGPEVPLCNGCAQFPSPTCEQIWDRIRERREAEHAR